MLASNLKYLNNIFINLKTTRKKNPKKSRLLLLLQNFIFLATIVHHLPVVILVNVIIKETFMSQWKKLKILS